MSNVIAIRKETFTSAIGELKNGNNEISVETGSKPDVNGSAEVLNSYMECMEEIKEAITAYKNMLENDISRINSAGMAMINAEKNLLKG